MYKLLTAIFLVLAIINSSGCTGAASKTENTADQQRKNAQEAQGELSSEIKR